MDSGWFSPVLNELLSAVGDYSNTAHKITLKDADGVTRVFPVAMIDNIIRGELSTTDVDGWDKILPVILSDWLDRAANDTGS